MAGRWILVTPPVGEPVTLAEAKADLRVDGVDHDATISAQISQARQMVEAWTGRRLMTATWRHELSEWPAGAVELTRLPVQSLSSVQYVDEGGTLQTLASSDWALWQDDWRAQLYPAYGKTWPATRCEPAAVRITLVLGYASAAAVPEPFKRAILRVVQSLFAQREAGMGPSGRDMRADCASVLGDYWQCLIG